MNETVAGLLIIDALLCAVILYGWRRCEEADRILREKLARKKEWQEASATMMWRAITELEGMINELKARVERVDKDGD